MVFEVIERSIITEEIQAIKGELNRFVETLGYTGIGDDWREIDRRTAEATTQWLLYRGLAYDTNLMPAFRACELTTQLLSLFDEARYFTNAGFNERGLCGWSGITEATFDAGLVCINHRYIGILWVQDED